MPILADKPLIEKTITLTIKPFNDPWKTPLLTQYEATCDSIPTFSLKGYDFEVLKSQAISHIEHFIKGNWYK